MKARTKSIIIILIIFGIGFAFSSIITTKLSFNGELRDKWKECSDKTDLEDEKLKISKVSEKIHIDNNWTAIKAAGICTGNGTYSKPYIIEDLIIDGGNSGSCIFIENSNVYFRIENCTVYNSGSVRTEAGIKLSYVNNAQLFKNNCSKNYNGMRLSDSNNITISGNTASNNWFGIYLFYCNDNRVLENNASDNGSKGIVSYFGDDNIISGNIANDNFIVGIELSECDYNIVSGNTARNSRDGGITLWFNYNNNISGNIASNNNYGICIYHSNYNTVSGNTANDNNYYGIHLFNSENNTILGDTANYNKYGIFLESSNYTTVTGNKLLGNEVCINETDCEGNVFKDNNCGEDDEKIPGYNPFFLLGILSVAAILITRKAKKSDFC